MECWNVGKMEYWVIKKEAIGFAFDINPLNPLFHYSMLPFFQMGGAHFILGELRAKKSSFDYHIVANLSSNF